MKKKLIEVALPLEAINKESAREKSIRHGHPSTLHLWWARRPLAACRAVLFASLVDDPSSHPEQFPTEEAQERERQRLFAIIEELVKWENSNNERVLEQARAEIMRSCNGNPPPVLDPFCGGGSIPLEAQRLGLKAHASDLNPVAVLITKALIEIPPKFANQPPVNPEAQSNLAHSGEWRGAQGLAEDVRYYGKWMRDEAEKRIGHLYPKVKVPEEYGGGEATVIAWLWTRTVKCPNPACGAQMPLVRSFWLSTTKGKQAWIKPVVEPLLNETKQNRQINLKFTIQTSSGGPPDGTVNKRGAICLYCSSPVSFDHIRAEGKAKRIDAQLMAIIAEGARGRIYLPPMSEHEKIAKQVQPKWIPESELPEQALGFRVQSYGMVRHADLFTARQLFAIATLFDLLSEVQDQIVRDAITTGLHKLDNNLGKDKSDTAIVYANAVVTYLVLAISKNTHYWCALATWHSLREIMQGVFARQAIPMVWDYAECNFFSSSSGNLMGAFEWNAKVLTYLPSGVEGLVSQADATDLQKDKITPLISTDPPYYDNVSYADLSDFFYVWLRKALSKFYPTLFTTLLTPKSQELIADPFRQGGREQSRLYFEEGMGKTFSHMLKIANPNYPLSVYYAFKQAETEEADKNQVFDPTNAYSARC